MVLLKESVLQLQQKIAPPYLAMPESNTEFLSSNIVV